MRLIWHADDAEPQHWDIDPDELFIGEIKALESTTGMTLGELGDGANRGSFTAMLAFLWIFRRRDEPGLSYDAMDAVPARQLELIRMCADCNTYHRPDEDHAPEAVEEGKDEETPDEAPDDEEPEPPARPTIVAS